MSARLAAGVAVHLLTATGGVCGLLALHFAAQQRWEATFVVLGIALVIDAIDGPLARRADVATLLPRFSGARLDQLIDYVNYCMVPAFIILKSGIFEGWWGVALSSLVVLSSLFHFADRASKTADGYFVGFPALWNIVALYMFVLEANPPVWAGLIVLLAGLTFVPVIWVHPFRVRWLRPLTVAVVGCWSLAAVAAVWQGFPGSFTAKVVFVLAALYIVGLGLARALVRESPPDRR